MLLEKEELSFKDQKNMIHITKKQASVSIALVLLLMVLIFITGYFWGKRNFAEQFAQKVNQESFNDQIDYLMTMQSFNDQIDKQQEPKQIEDDSFVKSVSVSEQAKPEMLVQKSIDIAPDLVRPTINVEEKKSSVKPIKLRANLIGFGTKKTALGFAARLKKHGIDVSIKTRVSKSASGKSSRTWYQAVTKTYTSEQELQQLVNKIARLEHIKAQDVKIIKL